MVEARTAFRTTVATLAAQDLVFVDESGVTTRMTRRYGRAPNGQRVPEAVPQHGHGQGMTMIGALGATGIQAAMTVVTDNLLANQLGPDAAMIEMRQQVENVMAQYR